MYVCWHIFSNLKIYLNCLQNLHTVISWTQKALFMPLPGLNKRYSGFKHCRVSGAISSKPQQIKIWQRTTHRGLCVISSFFLKLPFLLVHKNQSGSLPLQKLRKLMTFHWRFCFSEIRCNWKLCYLLLTSQFGKFAHVSIWWAWYTTVNLCVPENILINSFYIKYSSSELKTPNWESMPNLNL